jgi:hypothetical protein
MKTCSTCAHATKKPGHLAHYKLGLRNCDWLPDYHFVASRHTCNRWTAKAEKETV